LTSLDTGLPTELLLRPLGVIMLMDATDIGTDDS